METAQFGRSRLKVPRLAFGCWQAAGWINSGKENFVDTLRYAVERSITFIDTAEAYGDGVSESLVGEAVSGMREKVIIATKFRHTLSAPQKVRKSLEDSLRRLNTDYVDIYQQHWPPMAPPLEDTICELEKLKREGKVRFIGVSNWMEPEWAEFTDASRIDSLQPCYSLLWRSIEANVLPLCSENGLAVLAYSPLCQGALSGRFRSPEDIPKDVRRENSLFPAERFAQILNIVKGVEDVAGRVGKTPAQVALRWVLDQPGVTTAICGASSTAQVDENLGALDWHLPPNELKLLSDISASFSASLKPHDTLWNWHPKRKPAKN